MLVLIVVISTTIWSGIDSSNIAKQRHEKVAGTSTAIWVIGMLLLWIVVFPLYLVKRSQTLKELPTARYTPSGFPQPYPYAAPPPPSQPLYQAPPPQQAPYPSVQAVVPPPSVESPSPVAPPPPAVPDDRSPLPDRPAVAQGSFCPSCGSAAAADSAFCGSCGTAFAYMRRLLEAIDRDDLEATDVERAYLEGVWRGLEATS